jgi:thiol-disulfide isomerase/thioredoxin
MERTYKILKMVLLVLIFVALLLGAKRLYDTLGAQVQTESLATQASDEDAKPVRQAAPDFTVYDGEGNAHKLSDYQGKPVVLNFWASWCGPCKMEMPDFDEKYGEYGDQVHFLMVNLTDGGSETVESASAFIAEQGYTFPVYYDTAFSGANAYGIRSIPMTFFIDAQGDLVTYGEGMLSAEMLQKGISLLLPAETK